MFKWILPKSGTVNINIYDNRNHDIEKFFSQLKSIIMSVKDQMLAILGEIKGSVANVADDIDRIKAKLEGGLSAEEASAVIDELNSVSETLKDVAAKVPEEQTTGGDGTTATEEAGV